MLVFPGGDYDSYRPTFTANVVDFAGRTGYVRTAVEPSVPIVPMVSIGAQETHLFLARGDSIARRLGLTRARMEILPISFGFPFGLSVIFPPNIPLPSKIVTQVLDPIDVVAEFGEDPDVDEVDLHVRAVMQAALDETGQANAGSRCWVERRGRHAGASRDAVASPVDRTDAPRQVSAHGSGDAARGPHCDRRLRRRRARCPDRPGIIDERGTLTWKQLDARIDALGVALQELRPRTVAVMCRNHRGFVEALVAANRIGADVLLLNTSFAGPAMAEVIEREGADVVIYDQEFTATVDARPAQRAGRHQNPGLGRHARAAPRRWTR